MLEITHHYEAQETTSTYKQSDEEKKKKAHRLFLLISFSQQQGRLERTIKLCKHFIITLYACALYPMSTSIDLCLKAPPHTKHQQQPPPHSRRTSTTTSKKRRQIKKKRKERLFLPAPQGAHEKSSEAHFSSALSFTPRTGAEDKWTARSSLAAPYTPARPAPLPTIYPPAPSAAPSTATLAAPLPRRSHRSPE